MAHVRLFQNHLFIRILFPIFLIAVWLGVGAIGGPTFGKIASVESNDQASFLPSQAESTKVANLQASFQKSHVLPAIIVISSSHPLNGRDVSDIETVTAQLQSFHDIDHSQPIVGPIPSSDKKAVELVIPIQSTATVNDVVTHIQFTFDHTLPSTLHTYVTGPAGLTGALVDAFKGIDGILLLVALGAVFVILLCVYRSVLLPIIVLLLDVFALSGAILVVYLLAKAGAITLNGQAQGILSILVIGASTDYSLLLVSRYRESLHDVEKVETALFQAMKRALEPIAASAATVIIALLCLILSHLRSNQALGPVGAIGIAFSFIASLTFLPALLMLFGRTAFWPRRPRYELEHTSMKESQPGGVWGRVASWIQRAPRRIWMISSLILLVACIGLFQLKASGVSTADTIRVPSKAVEGQTILAEHFPAGSGNPISIVTPVSKVGTVVSIVEHTPGIESARFMTNPQSNQPLILHNQELLEATSSTTPNTSAAEKVVMTLRDRLHPISSQILVGGQTAITLDTNTTAQQDFFRITPLVLLVVVIILALLLRSLLAPLLLVLSVILSFAATMGISAIVFNHLFHFPGSDPAVPLFGFVFLVALGIDYNIFLMSRVREEAIHHDTRAAVLKGLRVTGGVITSAGIVLAATFTALSVIPILFLAQIAFIVAFGVLLDTIIVRSLIIPALSYDIGRFIWWPSKLMKKHFS